MVWVQRHTRTRDSHWKEAGASTPYRPFPEKDYFKPIVTEFAAEEVLFIEKSRDMMISWLGVGLFTHAAKWPARVTPNIKCEESVPSSKQLKELSIDELERLIVPHCYELATRTTMPEWLKPPAHYQEIKLHEQNRNQG